MERTANLCQERMGMRAEFVSRNEEDISADSLAACLHSFYPGPETLFETIAIEMDEGIPKGERWHKKLLLQMSSEIPGRRCQVISEKSFDRLEAFRAFRHLFRNLYTHHLNPEGVFNLTSALQQTWSSVKIDLQNFIDFLEKADEC